MRRPRVRHHTTDGGLEKIKVDRLILPGRGVLMVRGGKVVEMEAGVHVEVEPFASARPGRGGPIEEMGCHGEGAFVEFDAPPDRQLIGYSCGNRHTGLIPLKQDEPLPIRDLNPAFVKVRRYFWEFWRAKA